ncbi:MAG: VWA domain-containing protein [Myxococcaceae bacterium]
MIQRIVLVIASAVLASGCGNSDCSGDFCIDVQGSGYRIARCASDASSNCLFVDAYFTATDKGQPITDKDTLSGTLTVNDRETGVEGGADLIEGDAALQVDLLLDRSFSISESGSTEAVRSSVLSFIDALPEAATIRVAAFASEPGVPEYVGVNCGKDESFVGRETAKKIVTDCYKPYSTQTSVSQTKLYDAVGSVLAGSTSAPSVVVVFTDGTDTASTLYETPEAARDALHDRPGRRTTRIYAIGLGAEPNAQALKTLTDDRFFRASDTASLDAAFSSVSSELKSIFTFRVLVANQEASPRLHLKLTHKSRTVDKTFTMDD